MWGVWVCVGCVGRCVGGVWVLATQLFIHTGNNESINLNDYRPYHCIYLLPDSHEIHS